MHWPARVLWLLDIFLVASPFVAMESQFARGCSSQLSLWNDSIVLTNPIYWTNVWFALNVTTIVAKSYMALQAQPDNMTRMTNKYSGYRAQLAHLPANLQRHWSLLITISVLRILMATQAIDLCEYSLPVCYTLLTSCEAMVWLASSGVG